MKSLIILLPLCFLFASCKKCYTCTQYITVTFDNGKSESTVNTKDYCNITKQEKRSIEKRHTFDKPDNKSSMHCN